MKINMYKTITWVVVLYGYKIWSVVVVVVVVGEEHELYVSEQVLTIIFRKPVENVHLQYGEVDGRVV
jgi:hypothetical protein